jgi:transcriptional regulator with XRE-family HTH domain
MTMTPFSEKLRLVLKMLSMSSAQLASELGTDKSVISRWLKGSVLPSAHNLSRLTALVATRVESFRTLDWERDPQDFAEMFGADADTITRAMGGSVPSRGLPLANWDQMISTTARRGEAYEGFFRSTRPAPTMVGRFMHEHGMIRRDTNGLLKLIMGSAGSVVEGWMIPLHDQLYAIATELSTGTLLFGIFNGIGAPRVDVFDGLTLIPGSYLGRSPTAMAMMCERVGDLTGDVEADDRHCKELISRNPLAPEGSVPEHICNHLVRDFGPAQLALGGDWLLNSLLSRSLTSGPDFSFVPVPDAAKAKI